LRADNKQEQARLLPAPLQEWIFQPRRAQECQSRDVINNSKQEEPKVRLLPEYDTKKHTAEVSPVEEIESRVHGSRYDARKQESEEPTVRATKLNNQQG
jgi:hypothetical protein